MPWSQTTPMDQKTQFVADYLREMFSFTELCARFGVSRETGYKLGATLPASYCATRAPLKVCRGCVL
jgi:hypothetical protein